MVSIIFLKHNMCLRKISPSKPRLYTSSSICVFFLILPINQYRTKQTTSVTADWDTVNYLVFLFVCEDIVCFFSVTRNHHPYLRTVGTFFIPFFINSAGIATRPEDRRFLRMSVIFPQL